MNGISSKSLKTLEFDKVVDRLAAKTETTVGRELALGLQPSTDYQEVLRRQRLAAEGRRLLEMRSTFSLGGVRDVRTAVGQAALGHILEPVELLDVQATLSVSETAKATVNRLGIHLPLLEEMLSRSVDFTELSAEIGRCLNQRGEVVDDASPALRTIRIKERQAHDRLTARLRQMLASSSVRQAIQEPITTMRDGRYVILVKADMRGHVAGVVHDVSSSGATLFLEPLETVELGNQWRELKLEEEREVRRVLRELSEIVGEDGTHIAATIEILASLDLILASARLGETMGCTELPYPGPEQEWLLPSTGALSLANARHPLLADPVVPIDISVGGPHCQASQGDDCSILLITGPNTGGKTVALKTVGLLALMAQAGLPVPADRQSRLPIFEGVYADIGDEQSIEQSLSTFSSHMGNIISILDRASSRSLVLLDELGAGTDPDEGAALARAILRHLLEIGCPTVATTHHGSLKAFAHITPGMANGCVEFDQETLAPTYRLTIGLPGKSNAFAVASRLGMDDEILGKARRSLSPHHTEIESLIADLQEQRQAAETDRRAQAAARQRAETEHRDLQARVSELESERARLLERASQQLNQELAEARAQIRRSLKELDRGEREAIDAAREELTPAEKTAERFATKRGSRRESAEPLPAISPGDQLWLRDATGNPLSQPGEALGEPADGEIEVLLGAIRAKVKLADIDRVDKPSQKTERTAAWSLGDDPISPDVAVRGMTIEEALQEVDRHLDSAFLAGLPHVRIIHGKGTGTLRRAVREALYKHPLAKSLTSAEQREGGEGVTVVELVK